jgi:hypothetical protein
MDTLCNTNPSCLLPESPLILSFSPRGEGTPE